VEFETGSRVGSIEKSAFSESGLRSIVIPSSVAVVHKESFQGCRSLESVIFQSGSRLERIESLAFSGTRLTSIRIPWSVTDLNVTSFAFCESLESVILESDSRREVQAMFGYHGQLPKSFVSSRTVHLANCSANVVVSGHPFSWEISWGHNRSIVVGAPFIAVVLLGALLFCACCR
jgi:hypothetical protein